jgi:hypothetical protein
MPQVVASGAGLAETTVLKLLIRSWNMIANQTDRYNDIMADRK